jgi:hypothetical protein
VESRAGAPGVPDARYDERTDRPVNEHGDLPVMRATPFALSVTTGGGTAPPPAPFAIEVRSYPQPGGFLGVAAQRAHRCAADSGPDDGRASYGGPGVVRHRRYRADLRVKALRVLQRQGPDRTSQRGRLSIH